MTDINSLPLEALVEILIKIDGKTLGACRRVCKKWKEVIDDSDYIWKKICLKEYEYQSKIAKTKSGCDLKWYNVYKNLQMWSEVTNFEVKVREFYNFSLNQNKYALSINCGVLPIKDTRGIVLYDMNILQYIPSAVPEINCFKISNNDFATVMLLKSGILVQRNVENPEIMTEAFFEADNFVLECEEIVFYHNRGVYKCNLHFTNLSSKLVHQCKYDIRDMQYDNGIIHIFTDSGKILNIYKNGTVFEKSLNCPQQWLAQIKHICSVNDRNFVCYSRNLFKIETDKYRHLYLDFPPITALFFYVDFVLFGTKAGEILLYRLSSQKRATRPVFEKLAELPEGKFAVQLDVCERKSGPVIVASTYDKIILLEIDFFPDEKDISKSFTTNKLRMFKRLVTLKDRLRLGVPSVKSIA
ncbi:hypothetical protein K1T71_013927 [Dendrolimus kikuchii]|uniref:Uncharacterized protein n=1 Tax=Dendrolimus kikuchii TaxID=765133 RepID=A0ACC1CGD1_9NEOP|nr:hypothetical protein K1T71_013927 [Dendrolimus kikuchii]